MEPDASGRLTEMRDPFVGVVLGRRYEVLERLAEGGFGAVYRAKHVTHGLEIAVKILHPKMASDPRIVARFRREGAALTSLRSKNTVTTYELVEDGSTLFIVMELLTGRTLRDRFRAEGALPWQDVVGIARAVCESLAEAHAAGIVHRDLKPANIFLCTDGNVKVLDFGIAKLVYGSKIGDSGEDLTQANELVGTLDYVSPEQIAGESYTGRSDIYTLGVVMYEMLTSERPFAMATGSALLAMIVTSTPSPPSETRPGLPAAVDRVVMQALARDPKDRFADVGELSAALELVLEREESVTRATELPPADLPTGGRTPVPALEDGDEATKIMAERPLVELDEPTVATPPLISATGSVPAMPAAPPERPSEPTTTATEPAALIQPTLEGGWAAPLIAHGPPPHPADGSMQMAPMGFPPTHHGQFPPTGYPAPSVEKGIPLYVWIAVLVIAIVFGIILATI